MTQLFLNTAQDYLLLNGAGDWLLLDATPSATFPTSPSPMEVTVDSVSPTFVSVTHGLQRQARSRGAHAWRFELRFAGMTRANFAPLQAFLIKQAGQASTFTFTPPGVTNQGAGGGTPRVNGAGQSGSSLITDGWPVSTAILKAADWLQIENDPKVYMVTSDVISDGSGNATIPIFPALRRTPTDNFNLYTAPVFTCALDSDSLAVDWSQCLHALGFSITISEIQQP